MTKRKHPLAICEHCSLADKSCAPTDGPKDAKIAFVSRSPGYHEAIQGKPFSGPSGKILEHLFNQFGVRKDEVLKTNVVLCQTDEVPQNAIECCRPRLEHEIRDCDTIIAGGVEAANVTVGETSVSSARGHVHTRVSDDSTKQQRVIVTNNPAILLRDDATYPDLVRDFRLALKPPKNPLYPVVRYTDEVERGKAWVTDIIRDLSSKIGIILSTDIEARGRDGRSGLEHNAEVVCAGFSSNGDKAIVFGERCCQDQSFFRGYLRRLWELENVAYLWHNGKFDTKILRTSGVNARVDEDTLLISRSLDERPGNPELGDGGHALEYLLKDRLGWGKYEPASVKHFKKTGEILNHDELYNYNGLDTAGGRQLYDVLRNAAELDNVLERPYTSIFIPANKTLTRMELEGMIYDEVAAADILEGEVWPHLEELTGVMRQISHKPELNPNSTKQMAELLYDEWGVNHKLSRPKIEKKGKRSTDVYVRREITEGRFTCAVNTEAVVQFTEKFDLFKTLDKQRGTYLEGLILKRWPNGRIYYEFKLPGTETGRLSAKKPNMQNITRPKEGLPNIRRLFLADPGCTILAADYSQAELRAIAVLSGDEELQAIYLDSKRSLHKEVARDFYGEDYTYEQYVKAKNINFGVVFGQSAFSFHQMYKMPQDEAQRFIDWWWERFPKVKEWVEATKREVIENGELVSPFGHKRRFYLLTNENKDHALKEAVNFRPQNVAGNLTIWACNKLSDLLDWEVAQLRITVHDNIILNCSNDALSDVAHLVKTTMERAPTEALGWSFPFVAELSSGPNWGELTDMEL